MHDFTLAEQDWIGLMIFKNFVSGLDWIQFYLIRTVLGLINFTVRSSLLEGCHICEFIARLRKSGEF